MERVQYVVVSAGDGYEEKSIETTEKVFNKIKDTLTKNERGNTLVDIWSSTKDNGAYYETKTYFDCKNEKGCMLYILIERKAKKGFAFV